MAKTKANRAKPSPPPPFLGEKPTPERMAQAGGDMHEGRTMQGLRVWSDPSATPLRRAHRANAKLMTRAMLDAGERYEEDRCIVWGSPSGRDSLDQSPRGGASAPASEGLARAQARLYAAEVAVSAALSGDPRRGAMTAPRALELLRGVCHEHARLPPPRSWERGLLNAALRALVAHYGLEG